MQRDVEFLYELGTMRYLPRAWTQAYAWHNFANLAEHSMRVGWIALMLAERAGKPYDRAKLLTFALCHDLGEVRAGDATILHKRYASRNEDKAVQDILEQTSLGELIKNEHKAYEERTSYESKLVKDADLLDVQLELREQADRGLNRVMPSEAQRQAMRSYYHTDVARELFDTIFATPSNSWLARMENEFDFTYSSGKVHEGNGDEGDEK